MTPSASPRVTAYAGLAALFLFACTRDPPARAGRSSPPRSRSCPALGLALARSSRAAGLAHARAADRARAGRAGAGARRLLGAADRAARAPARAARRARARLGRARALAAARLGGRTDDQLRLRCARWGNYRIGDIRLRARDRLGLLTWETRLDRRTRLRVYPLPETLRAIVTPVSTQPFAGNQVSRQKGEGLEFADLREFAAGDRVRSINWRASARRNVLVVNERHPERNADVILFLDTFADARAGGRSTLDLAVRATATLATQLPRAP